MRALALICLLLPASWLAAQDVGPDPLLRTKVELSRSEVVLHEQISFRLSVTHNLGLQPRWEAPPFDGFWAERLPASGGPVEHDAQGRAFRTTVFRRALYPTRSGAVNIPGSRLWVRGEAKTERPVEVPGARLRVRPLPEKGRPAGFRGIVGSVRIKRSISAGEVEVGRALSLVVEVYGSANLWDAPAPQLSELPDDRVEVFREPPRTFRGVVEERITTRRQHRFELVPLSPGLYSLPAFKIDYFDPAAGRYVSAATEPISFRALASQARQPAPWEETQRPASPDPGRWSRSAAVLALLGLLSAVILTRWWRRSTRRWQRTTLPHPGVLYAKARAAAGSDACGSLLADAVRAAIHVRHRFDPGALSTDELEASIDDPEAVALLRALDTARFGTGREQATELMPAVERYLSG